MGIKYSSKQYELLVLQSMCTQDAKILGALASRVDKGYFAHESSREAYEYIGEYIASNGKAPSLKVFLADPDISSETRNDMAESAESDDPITTIVEADAIVKVLHKYKQRRAIKGINKLLEEEMEGDEIDAELVLTKIAEAVAAAQAKRGGEDCFTHYGKNANNAPLTKAILHEDNSEQIIPTGIKEFDEQAGGLARGSLVLMGAPSGCGKSLVAGAVATNIAHNGYKVTLSPLEMSAAEMHNRIMAKITRYPLKKIRLQQLATGEKADAEAKMDAWNEETAAKGGRLTIYKPNGDVSIQELLAATAAFKSDVKIIDYVGLLSDADEEEQWKALGKVARFCKIHAEAENCVVILLVQVNEEGKVKYSSAMVEHATNALLWSNFKEIKETGLMYVIQLKSRNSSADPFRMRQNHQYMDIEEVTAEAEALGAIAVGQELPTVSVTKKK
jgi:replicative DNA helicase